MQEGHASGDVEGNFAHEFHVRGRVLPVAQRLEEAALYGALQGYSRRSQGGAGGSPWMDPGTPLQAQEGVKKLRSMALGSHTDASIKGRGGNRQQLYPG